MCRAVSSPAALFSGETCNCLHWQKKKSPCKKHWKTVSRKQQMSNTYKNPNSFSPVFLCGISQRNGAYFIMKGIVLMWRRWCTFPSQLHDYTFKSTQLKTDCLSEIRSSSEPSVMQLLHSEKCFQICRNLSGLGKFISAYTFLKNISSHMCFRHQRFPYKVITLELENHFSIEHFYASSIIKSIKYAGWLCQLRRQPYVSMAKIRCIAQKVSGHYSTVGKQTKTAHYPLFKVTPKTLLMKSFLRLQS